MKRFFISSILIATLTIASVFTPELTINSAANGTSVSAAVVNPIKAKTPTVKATERTATTVTLKAGNVSKASGYQLYRAASANGTYKYIGSTKNGTYVDKGLASAKSYYYKARAYKTVSGVKYYSKYSSAAVAAPAPGQSAQSKDSGITKVVWSNVSGVKNSGGTNCYKVYSYKVPVTGNTSGNTNTPTPKPTTTPAPTKTPASTAGGSDTNTYDSSFASQVLKIVNQERAKAGVSALTMSNELVAPANKRAKEIKQSFSHTRPNGTAWSTVLSEYNVSVSAAGENIAYGYNTPEKVMEGWMNSPGHRANILNASFHHIGIGVYNVNGTVYCSQLFSN